MNGAGTRRDAGRGCGREERARRARRRGSAWRTWWTTVRGGTTRERWSTRRTRPRTEHRGWTAVGSGGGDGDAGKVRPPVPTYEHAVKDPARGRTVEALQIRA